MKIIKLIEKVSPDDIDFDVCYKGHDTEQFSKNFNRWSLFIKKLLTKNVCVYVCVCVCRFSTYNEVTSAHSYLQFKKRSIIVLLHMDFDFPRVARSIPLHLLTVRNKIYDYTVSHEFWISRVGGVTYNFN